jgi:HK97 gp10 family phage protein
MEVKGISQVVAQLRKYGKEVEEEIGAITQRVASEIELDAKNIAPTNFGSLGQSIISVEKSKTVWEISAGGLKAPYAPFVEFGTGTLVNVPTEWTEIAAQFKGKKIGLQDGDFLKSIKEWCKFKGIEEKYAFAIMLKLLRVGQRPQPYMYPSYVKGRKSYLLKLKTLLKRYGSTK